MRQTLFCEPIDTLGGRKPFLKMLERIGLVVPLWHPQWLNHRHKIRPLEEPLGLLGGTDQATLVLSKRLLPAMDPELLAKLKKLTLGNAAVTALDYAICRESLTPADAAQRWLAAQ